MALHVSRLLQCDVKFINDQQLGLPDELERYDEVILWDELAQNEESTLGNERRAKSGDL